MSNFQNTHKLYFNKSKLFIWFLIINIFAITSFYLTLNPSASDNSYTFIIAPISLLFFGYFGIIYLYFLITNKPLIEINQERIIINSLKFGSENVLLSEIISISELLKNVANSGKYGSGIIKPKFVQIITKNNQKIHISTNATGKTQTEIFDWLKQNCTNYPNSQNIKFLEN